MAYDSDTYHEPPRRDYYGGQQQVAPTSNGYQSRQQQYGHRYEQQEPAYNQASNEQYDYNGGYGDVRQARQPQSPSYDDSYNRYNGSRQPASGQINGYGTSEPSYERHYDPRYQSREARGRQPAVHQPMIPSQQERPARGRQPNYEQPPVQPQSRAQNPPIDQQFQTQRPRPNPKDARMYTQASSPQQQANQEGLNDLAPPPRIRDHGVPRPQTAPQQESRQQQRDSSRARMEDWKARERARMHQETMSPETLAWDNAFPVFPTKRERSRAPGDRSGTDSAMGSRTSGEQSRPPTSSSQRQEARPDVHRTNSDTVITPAHQQTIARPNVEHKPYSFDAVQGRPTQQEVSPPSQRMPPGHTEWPQTTSPVQAQPPPQWPQQQSPPPTQSERPMPPPQPNSTSANQREAAQVNHQAQGYHQQQAQAQVERAQQQTRQPPPRGPVPQRIDVRPNQQQQMPASMDHQPLSPAGVPPRPSTSSGTNINAGPRSPFGQPTTSSTSAYLPPQAPQDQTGTNIAQPAQPWSQQHGKQGSLSEIYRSYENDEHRMPPPTTAPRRTRDEQIEADMPDFDSAAPGGTSLLHKRSRPNMNQTHVNQSPPPMPNMPVNYHQHSQNKPSYEQQYPDMAEQRSQKQTQGGITDGFVFGVPGESSQQTRQLQPQSHPQQQHEAAYQQRTGSYRQQPQPERRVMKPPIPPYAHGQQPRRSMDDARQMPYRQAPPTQQRSPPNAQGSKGPYQPQQRPAIERDMNGPSSQSTWSDPSQDRMRNAPPLRQTFQQPPASAQNGAALTQQRSNPDSQLLQNPSGPVYHPPPPVRPGLMDQGHTQPAKPPPVRNYDNAPPPVSHERQVSVDRSSRPVTIFELNQLRAAVDASAQNTKQAMHLVQKLVEAATVLPSEDGRVDQRTASKNRENYLVEAHKRLKKLVAAGYPEAQFYMADCYGQGSMGLEVDPKEAFKLYQAAAKAGHGQAAYRTAMCCELGPEDGGGTSKDYAKAAQWYRRGAALGDAEAMFKIGIILLKGLLGQQRNMAEAVNFLKRAVSVSPDNPHALFELAQLYESTNTNPEVRNKVVADDGYALELFQQAANNGHKSAQFRLGQAYEYGQFGVPIDNRASITWYTKAAAQGQHEAELALSGWYLTGAEGILGQSDTEAYLWARKAAQSEPPLAKSMFAMGYFTETGIGCPPSIEEAKRWYGRAAAYKFPKAQERLEELRKTGGKGSKAANGKLTRKDQKRLAY